MNKSKRSLIAMNRNLFVTFAILLGLAVSGVIAWQVSATNGTSNQQSTSAQNTVNQALPWGETNAPASQEGYQAIYRGVTTAIRFDISPPLRAMRQNTEARQERER